MANYTSKYTGQEIDSLLEKAANITNFTIKDVYLTLEALNAAFPNGDEYAYQVESNRNVYIWSTKNNEWESIGQIEGPQGEAGKDGSAGADGKSAYQSAVDGGYEGTEEEFNEILATAQTQFTQLNESLSKQNRGKQWIINWDWTNPVNQRNEAIYLSDESYFFNMIDMWKGQRLTLTINSDYINITSSQTADYKRMTQMFESNCKLESGKKYTLTLYAKCNTISGKVVLRPCTHAYGTMVCQSTYQLELSQSTDYKYYQCTFSPASDEYGFGVEVLCTNNISDYFDIDIKGWKLEEGEVSTLPNDAPTIGDEELSKCQGYYQELFILGTGYSLADGGRLQIAIPILEKFTSTPTLIEAVNNIVLRKDGVDILDCSITAIYEKENIILFNITPSSGTLESRQVYGVYRYDSSKVKLSCEL